MAFSNRVEPLIPILVISDSPLDFSDGISLMPWGGLRNVGVDVDHIIHHLPLNAVLPRPVLENNLHVIFCSLMAVYNPNEYGYFETVLY